MNPFIDCNVRYEREQPSLFVVVGAAVLVVEDECDDDDDEIL